MTRRSFAVLLLIAGPYLGLPHAITVSHSASAASTQPISPVAVVSWATVPHAEDRLDLLVLWRGSPGWWTAGPVGPSSTSLSEGGFSAHARYGERDLSLSFDSVKRVAIIQGLEVPVGTHNVVMVDDVDAPRGATIAGLQTVEPSMEPRHIEAVIRRSQEMIRFLRCDVKLSDPKFDVIASRLCDMVLRGSGK